LPFSVLETTPFNSSFGIKTGNRGQRNGLGDPFAVQKLRAKFG